MNTNSDSANQAGSDAKPATPPQPAHPSHAPVYPQKGSKFFNSGGKFGGVQPGQANNRGFSRQTRDHGQGRHST